MLAGSGTGSLFPNEITMTKNARRASFPRMIDQFLRQRVAETLPPRELERLRVYLHSLIADRQSPPKCGSRPDWSEIGQECSIPVETLERVNGVLAPAIDAITRFVGPQAAKRKQSRWRERNHKTKLNAGRHRSVPGKSKLSAAP